MIGRRRRTEQQVASSITTKGPSFFKVLIGDFANRLQIPPAFVKSYPGIIPSRGQIILSDANGGSWHVDVLQEVDGCFILGTRWSSFVLDNSLLPHEFLTFRYTGNSKFLVKIYGKNGCEKNTLPPACQQVNPDEKAVTQDKETGNTASPTDPDDDDVQIPEPEISISDSFQSRHPFFKVVMGRTYAHVGQVNIPNVFFKKYMGIKAKSVVLRVSEKSWTVNFVPYSNSCGKFHGGWPKFVKDNNLQIGDECIFELVDDRNLMFKVSIFSSSCLDT